MHKSLMSEKLELNRTLLQLIATSTPDSFGYYGERLERRKTTFIQKNSPGQGQGMMTPTQYYRLTTSPTIPSYLPFCHPPRFLPPPSSHKNPNLVSSSSSREKPRFSPSFVCFASSSSSSSSPMATPTQSSETKPFSVLFVCLGNICRSPAAEGVFRDIVKKRGLDSSFIIDSAGTIDYHEVIDIQSLSSSFLLFFFLLNRTQSSLFSRVVKAKID